MSNSFFFFFPNGTPHMPSTEKILGVTFASEKHLFYREKAVAWSQLRLAIKELPGAGRHPPDATVQIFALPAVFIILLARDKTREGDEEYWHLGLEKEMATHSSVLAWRIPGTGEPGGLLSMGSHRVGHDWSDSAAAAVDQLPSFLLPSIFLPSLSH